MKRRNFIKASVAAPSLLGLRQPQKTKTKLELIILNTNWGWEGNMDEFCKKIKEAGYDGMEIWWPGESQYQKELFDGLQKYELQYGILLGGGSEDYKTHKTEFYNALIEASSHGNQKPLYINCHSGRDYFSFEENCEMIAFTLEQEAKTGIEIYHETHRGRMCYAAPITRKFLEKFSNMKLTLDISHWTNVHESMLDDQSQTVDLAIKRSSHIHARVGHPEGPQVSDPRAPEWRPYLDKHLMWWDRVIAHRESSGEKRITFLTEFGPPLYMQTLPYTLQPVASQWDINVYMKDLLKQRYK